jgi:hypothetical protein
MMKVAKANLMRKMPGQGERHFIIRSSHFAQVIIILVIY